MINYLWSGTDTQVPTLSTSIPPQADYWEVTPPRIPPPCLLRLWEFEQHEMPYLTAADDGGWTPFFTAGVGGISQILPSAYDLDVLPTPPSVTPQEDWNVLSFIGVPVRIPPPRVPDPNQWINDLVPSAPGLRPDSAADPYILSWLVVTIPPPQRPCSYFSDPDMLATQGGGGGGTVIQMIVLQQLGDGT